MPRLSKENAAAQCRVGDAVAQRDDAVGVDLGHARDGVDGGENGAEPRVLMISPGMSVHIGAKYIVAVAGDRAHNIGTMKGIVGLGIDGVANYNAVRYVDDPVGNNAAATATSRR